MQSSRYEYRPSMNCERNEILFALKKKKKKEEEGEKEEEEWGGRRRKGRGRMRRRRKGRGRGRMRRRRGKGRRMRRWRKGRGRGRTRRRRGRGRSTIGFQAMLWSRPLVSTVKTCDKALWLPLAFCSVHIQVSIFDKTIKTLLSSWTYFLLF